VEAAVVAHGEVHHHASASHLAQQVVVDLRAASRREAGEVLDTINAGRQGVLHPDEELGVGDGGKPGPVRPVDERHEIGHGELSVQLVGLRRREPARGHHLHDVNAALGMLRDGCAHVAGHRAAEEGAVAAGGRDRRPRRDHAG